MIPAKQSRHRIVDRVDHRQVREVLHDRGDEFCLSSETIVGTVDLVGVVGPGVGREPCRTLRV